MLFELLAIDVAHVYSLTIIEEPAINAALDMILVHGC